MYEKRKNLTKDLLDGSMVTEMDDNECEKQFAKHETKALQQTIVDIFVNLCDSENIVKVSEFAMKFSLFYGLSSLNLFLQ